MLTGWAKMHPIFFIVMVLMGTLNSREWKTREWKTRHHIDDHFRPVVVTV